MSDFSPCPRSSTDGSAGLPSPPVPGRRLDRDRLYRPFLVAPRRKKNFRKKVGFCYGACPTTWDKLTDAEKDTFVAKQPATK
ncbi:MAG: hypothetical protein J7M14_06680 [Planctomycetes bacterium]|nr:hypothetical protein [Planctomycetota bacterium]